MMEFLLLSLTSPDPSGFHFSLLGGYVDLLYFSYVFLSWHPELILVVLRRNFLRLYFFLYLLIF